MNLFGLPDPSEFTKKPKLAKNIKRGMQVPDAASLFFEEEDLWDFEREKQAFIDHMDFLKNQSVYESTLYKKWRELRELDTTTHIVRTGMYENLLWEPRDIYDRDMTLVDVMSIKPRVIVCDEGTEEFETWKYLRYMIHTFEFTSGIGRLMRFIIKDDHTGKVLGIASLASDVVSLGVRDKYIGWDQTMKFDDRKLNHTAIASTIVPTQPFGYNFLGGKLLASMLLTKEVRDGWKEKFGDVLVGITTTSLYGAHSMYQRIPFWRELGKSAGRISLKPDAEYFAKWVNWLKLNRREEYERAMFPKQGFIFEGPHGDWEWSPDGKSYGEYTPTIRGLTRQEVVNKITVEGYSVHDDNRVYDPRTRDKHPPSGPKQQLMLSIYRACGIVQSKYEHGFERGVYFAPIYTNTTEFLRGKISDGELAPSPKIADDTQSVMDWWRDKAVRRYENLLENDRIKPEHLYYRPMIKMRTWDEVREHYLDEVGR